MSDGEIEEAVRPVVMVVDDNDELRELLRLWLERRGCPAHASTGTLI